MVQDLNNYLAQKFKGSKTYRLEKLTVKIKSGGIIPKGTLVIMASGDTQLRLKILEKDPAVRDVSKAHLVQ